MNIIDFERVIRVFIKSGFFFLVVDFNECRCVVDKVVIFGLIEKINFWCNVVIKGVIFVIELFFDVDIFLN